jgi:DNA-binding transcriptional LysR family regulator
MPAVQSLLNTSPDLRISVDVAPSTVLFRGLEEGRYDFILGRKTPHSNPQDFRFHPGRIEIVSLMVHKSHPLAEKSDVEIAELSNFPWIIQDEGNPIRDAVENVFHTQKIPVPMRILNSSSLLVALSQIAEGFAIAPQTEEVMRLLTSDKINANVTVLKTRTRIEVAPYFVIQNARGKLPRAAERLLNEVMSKL